MEEILKSLKELGTEQNRKIYKRHGAKEPLFGVSFANIDKIVKTIVSPEGKKKVHHQLGLELWETSNSDAQTLALKIMEAKKMSQDWLETNAPKVSYYVIADLMAALVAKSSFAEEIMLKWVDSESEYIKRMGYGILNQFTRKKGLNSEYYLPFISKIEEEIQNSKNRAKEGMNNCLIAIGAINENLRQEVVKAAKNIGTVEIDHGETSCQTFIIEDYLERIYARRK